MSTHVLGVGIIGAGPATQAIHLPTLATLGSSFTVRRVMDPDATVAEAVAQGCGAVPSTEVSAVLDDPSVEVVAICSPNDFHAAQIIAACEAGKKAVLCEKPFAVTREEAILVQTASKANGVPIFVGTMHAYDPAYRTALAFWNQLGESAFNVQSSIYCPSNDVYINQATQQLPPAPRPAGVPLAGAVFRKSMMRLAMLGLAIHNIPLVRDFQPRVGVLHGARFFPPFGYSLAFSNGSQHGVLAAFVRGDWPTRWTMTAEGPKHRIRIDFPPSYVLAGSARVVIEGATGERTFQSRENGYQALWRAVEGVVRGQMPMPIGLDAALADLSFALDLADAAGEFLEVGE